MTDRDISGDGAADLMVVASDGFLYYYPNNSKSNPGRAPFTNAEWKSPGPTWGDVRAITAGDISGDGAADLMVVASDGFLYYYPNNSKSNPGRAPFTNAEWKSPGPTWGDVRAITAGDISGDGAADLMVVASDGFLYYYPNNSKSNPGRAPFTNAEWKSPGPTWGQSRLA